MSDPDKDAKAVFDRQIYMRDYMRKRRGSKCRKPNDLRAIDYHNRVWSREEMEPGSDQT